MESWQLSQLRLALAWRRQALVEELKRDMVRARDERFAQLAHTTPDIGDASVTALLAEVDQAEVSRYVMQLRDVEAARTRLADGVYGTCVDCGADIGFERLRAEPSAARCVDCQRRHEKTYRR